MNPQKSFFRILVCLFTLFLSGTAFAQENFVPGYIIDLQGKKIQGQVDYRNWGRNPKQIEFLAEGASKLTKYTPIEIAEFGVKNDIYKSDVVEAEISPFSLNQMDDHPELRIRTDTAFVQVWFSGEKSLYYYKTPEGHENFYIRKNGELNLLKHKKYIKTKKGERIILEDRTYSVQLSEYLNDCARIYPEIQSLKYEMKNLEKLFETYYDCVSSELLYQKKKERTMMVFYGQVGLSINNLQCTGDGFTSIVNSNFNRTPGFFAGGAVEFVLPRNMRKWTFYNEIGLGYYEVEGGYQDYTNDDIFTNSFTSFGALQLEVKNMIRYRHPMNNSEIFFNAGILNGFALSSTNQLEQEVKFYNKHIFKVGPALPNYRKHEQGFVIGAGMLFRDLSIEFRYEFGNGMSKYAGINTINHQYFVLIGYRFAGDDRN